MTFRIPNDLTRMTMTFGRTDTFMPLERVQDAERASALSSVLRQNFQQ